METYLVAFVSMRVQARFDIPQAVSAGEPSKGHREVLIPARKVAYTMVSLIPVDAFIEFVTGDDLK